MRRLTRSVARLLSAFVLIAIMFSTWHSRKARHSAQSGRIGSVGTKAPDTASSSYAKLHRNRPGYLLWESVDGTAMPEAIGVLLMLHGCSHSALDFWTAQAGCEECKGLPEEKLVVDVALKRGLVPAAVSSVNRCWQGQVSSEDWLRVKESVQHVIKKEELRDKPIYAFGASSGAFMASLLPQGLKLAGVILQIMAAMDSSFTSPPGPYPPTVFIHMPRDHRTKERVAGNVASLEKLQTPVREFEVPPLPLTPTFFSDRSSTLSANDSERIFMAFRNDGLLTVDGYLADDPRRSQWRETLRQAEPFIAERDGLVADESAVSELLNVAYAQHELTAQYVDDAIRFLLANTP